MSSFFQTVPEREAESAPIAAGWVNPWTAALAALAGVLLLGGVIAVAVGFGIMGGWTDTVIGQAPGFDQGAAAAIVGAAAIGLGILVGTCWLVLGALGWSRRD